MNLTSTTVAARGTPPGFAPSGPRLLQFFEQLMHADDLPALERTYLKRVREFVDMPMYGLYLFGHDDHQVQHIAAENVSDFFIARYEEIVRSIDPLLRHTLAEHTPADNMMIMPLDQWRQHVIYREALGLHGMIYALQSPVLAQERVIGTLAWGSDDVRHSPTQADREIAGDLGRLFGIALEVVRERTFSARAQGQVMATLDRSASPMVITDTALGHRHLNASAKALLSRVVDGDAWIDRLTARSHGIVSTAAQAQVRLVGGGETRLEIRSEQLEDFPSTTVSFLQLAGGVPTQLPAASLSRLTPREREVATLAAEGLTAPEIAERLVLSPHTARQYLKIVYRKLGVSSRVALARLCLGAAASPPGTEAGHER